MSAAVMAPKPLNKENLLDYFLKFSKPVENHKVGIEAELLPVDQISGRVIGYTGPRGVEGILLDLNRHHRWECLFEDSHIVALKKGRSEIHLEPGAQIELSSNIHSLLKDNLLEIESFYDELRSVSSERGIAWLEVGAHPLSIEQEISFVPKSRYEILSRYLSKKGKLSLQMMKLTATLQANFDFFNIENALLKLRTALAVAPILVGVFANSPFAAGKFSGIYSYRSHIWRNTDADRCGFIPCLLSDQPSMEQYLDWLLERPAIFLIRNGKWVDMNGMHFSKLLSESDLDLSDWKLFLSSIFTDARLNPFVEVRFADRNSLAVSMSFLALMKGLLSDKKAMEEAWSLLRHESLEEREYVYQEAARLGLQARTRSGPILPIAQELFHVAKRGLYHLFRSGVSTEDESSYLKPLEEILFDHKKSPAEQLLDRWNGEWHQDISKLIEHVRI